MNNQYNATATIHINAPASKIWDALVNPEAIKQYMFGSQVVSDWKQGSSIVWKGEWQGKNYEDKGTILQLEPGKTLQYTHYSPMTGQPDKPENYHTVTITLSGENQGTKVQLTQDNNHDAQEKEHAEKNWMGMLEGLKKYVDAAQ